MEKVKRKNVFVDGSRNGRVCVDLGYDDGYTIQKILDPSNLLHKITQGEIEFLAIIKAIELIDSGNYNILSDAKNIISLINDDNRKSYTKKWMRHKVQRLNRLLKIRTDLDLKFIWIPRELNRAGLRLDGINPNLSHYLEL